MKIQTERSPNRQNLLHGRRVRQHRLRLRHREPLITQTLQLVVDFNCFNINDAFRRPKRPQGSSGQDRKSRAALPRTNPAEGFWPK